MGKWTTKKNVLLIATIGSLLIVSLVVFDSRACYVNAHCKMIGDFINQKNLFPIFILPFVFFFSLLTYFMKDGVFQSWWNFARWATPTIIVISFILNGSGGGGFGIPDLGGVIVLVPLYILFISISIVRIGVALYKDKKGRGVPALVSIVLTLLLAAAILYTLWQVAASL